MVVMHDVKRAMTAEGSGGRKGSENENSELPESLVALVEPIAPGRAAATGTAARSRPALLEEAIEHVDAAPGGSTLPRTLAEALRPVPVETFLGSAMGTRFLRLQGRPDRFSSLLPWDVFNAVLRRTRLDSNRIRLMHDDVRLPASVFLEDVPQLAPLGRPLRLDTAVVEDYLRRGASLVLHGVDELVDEVGVLARSFELALGSPVQVNAWVKYGANEGIGAHWDDHDTFILQVHGVKHWTVHRPTLACPMPDDFGRPPAPTEDPVFDGPAQPGDLLYMPRGWWHCVGGLGGATMHLTFGTRPATGLSLLSLARRRLHEYEAARRDLPRFASPEEQRRYVADLRAALLEVLDDDVVAAYLLESDAGIQARPHPSLPWAAMSGDLEPELRVRLCTPRRLSVHAGPGAGQAQFATCGKRWVVSVAAVPLLRALVARRPVTVAALAGMAAPPATPAAARGFVRALVDHGVVEVLGPSLVATPPVCTGAAPAETATTGTRTR